MGMGFLGALQFMQNGWEEKSYQMLQFCLFLLSRLFLLSFVLLSFLFYLLSFDIIYISELGLFLLSFVDNNYADKTLVYKVASYT